MNTSRQLRRRRRLVDFISRTCVLAVLTFAGIGMYVTCGLIPLIICFIITILIVFNSHKKR